ncbi:phage head spike fiber domain-containing protein [Plesiomonas shigelloides]|uniref:phage head spike fiber domain-containing protein n=1 Tax=Plesiomonas shigelloides TaxID=703 RepID=UPI002FC73448
MAGVWKRDGTVTVTSGSKRVIGVGTTFADPKNGVAKGHIFTQISGSAIDLYEVDYVVSNTELYLVQAFRGTTASGAAYAIITTFSDSIPEFSRKLTATLASYQEQSDVLQLLYTSDAAEITVTAPDGTVRKLIPWKRVTSEGEGQAARAKIEADRAKTEADRAKTEADKAAQVVIDSAVPFPDVWIPFNDSLRMFAGYGREVKVGDDVVARMVNFERNGTATFWDKSGVFRTAAINEPRFEKQGLLIEGQSTNLFPWSQQFIDKWQLVNASLSPDATFPNAVSLDNSINGFVHTSAGILEVGSTYTISAIVKGFGEQSEIRSRFSNFSGPLIKKENFGAYTLLAWSLSIPSSAGINHAVTGINWPAGKVDGVTLCALQIEKLPFASSYIPTNGAAVTRAADKCWIPAAGNIPLNLNSMTQSASIDILGKGLSSWPRLVEINHPADRGALVSMVDGTWGGASLPVSITGNSMISTVAVARYEDGKLFNDGRAGITFSRYQSIDAGGIVYIAGYPAVATRWFFGHIKNLRIWRHALSDTQIRGLK